jgi:hypothetical protein
MIESRWLNVHHAAAFLSLRVDVFRRAVREGKLPLPSTVLGPRSPRCDREALPRAAVAALAEKIGAGTRPERLQDDPERPDRRT